MVNKILHALVPPPEWKVPVIITLGVICGLGLLIFRISNASAYLSDNPQVCINCHVMTPQYATWQRSSHAKVATCNDCHVPHENFVRTYAFKASDGTRHAFMFTFKLEPQVIRIKEAGLNVVQDNCIRCHYNFANETSLITVSGVMAKHGEGKFCFDCHRGVPHGLINSLSSHPFARVPQLTPVMPEWLKRFTEAKD